MIKSIEICNHCGKSVAVGKSCFINRIPDLNSIDTRTANGLKYPTGDFICYECDCKNSDSWKPLK